MEGAPADLQGFRAESNGFFGIRLDAPRAVALSEDDAEADERQVARESLIAMAAEPHNLRGVIVADNNKANVKIAYGSFGDLTGPRVRAVGSGPLEVIPSREIKRLVLIAVLLTHPIPCLCASWAGGENEEARRGRDHRHQGQGAPPLAAAASGDTTTTGGDDIVMEMKQSSARKAHIPQQDDLLYVVYSVLWEYM